MTDGKPVSRDRFLYLSSALIQHRAMLRRGVDSGAVSAEAANRMMEQSEREIDHWVQQLQQIPPGADRARTVHSMIEGFLKEFHQKNREVTAKVTCRKKCSFCCHIHVGITKDEADLLADRVKGGIKIDRERLKAQAEWGDDTKAYFQPDKKAARCVFLGSDDLCRVYDDRPSVCRNYFVVSDPQLCKPNPDGTYTDVMVVFSSRTEAIASAALNLEPDQKSGGSLPTLLLERLNDEVQLGCEPTE